MTRETLRDFAIALSIANLCFLRVWHGLLSKGFLTREYPRRDYVVAILNVWLLTSLLWILLAAGRWLAPRCISEICRWIPLLFLFPPANYLRAFILGLTQQKLTLVIGKWGLVALALGAPAVTLYAFLRWRRRWRAVAETVALGLVTFLPVTLTQAAWWAIVGPRGSGTANEPAKIRSGNKPPAQRIVWLIFDELDQRLTFSERPPTLQLPEIDRLRREALYAGNAYPPAAAATLAAIPALITGRRVSEWTLAGGREFRVRFFGSTQAVNLDSQSNLFSRVRAAGWNAAVTGWGFPYCRVWGSTLTSCSWQPMIGPQYSEESGLLASMQNQIGTILPWAPRQEHISQYLQILHDARKLAADPEMHLVLVHWPTPHHPPIYDRHTGKLTLFLFRNLTDWYLHNLGLVDRTLGELRRTMESAGTWENSTVLLTSDHPWRSSAVFDGKTDLRIPFLLKLAGQKRGITYDRPFNTVLTHDLFLALLRGELSSPEMVVSWLDRHGSSVKVLIPVSTPGD